jgi:tetratricopeptide (TPR) repeat protein
LFLRLSAGVADSRKCVAPKKPLPRVQKHLLRLLYRPEIATHLSEREAKIAADLDVGDSELYDPSSEPNRPAIIKALRQLQEDIANSCAGAPQVLAGRITQLAYALNAVGLCAEAYEQMQLAVLIYQRPDSPAKASSATLIQAYELLGKIAANAGSFAEAISTYSKALELLQSQPPSDQRSRNMAAFKIRLAYTHCATLLTCRVPILTSADRRYQGVRDLPADAQGGERSRIRPRSLLC